MKSITCLLVATTLFAGQQFLRAAETEGAVARCLGESWFVSPDDAPSGRHYAPDKEVRVKHLAIEVTPDFKRRTIAAKATLEFETPLEPLRVVRLNAVDLHVQSVTGSRKIQAHQVTGEEIIVTFAEDLPKDAATTLEITYTAEPTKGLYFRTPEMGYKEGDTHLFTQGESIEGRNWYPCVDAPNQQFTSEITCRLPAGMVAIANGRLLSTNSDAATGLVAWHWSQEKVHANYLISLCAGYFKGIEDKYKELPIAFYTPASEIAYAATSFRDTKDMLAFFEEETGTPYPWAKYDQVCVNDFVAGGMENTSTTTLTDFTLFTDATENIRDSEGLVAHELAHQWFGDLVTCRNWSDTWLNEGFATFYETLYTEHKHGRDHLLYELYQRARMITSITNTDAIVRRTYTRNDDMFSHLSYQKGSWVLHMLRSQLGPELYRRCIQTYLQRHAHQNVTTENLRAVIAELSGRYYEQFFDQWVYHGGQPELDLSYSWDEPAKLATVTVRQTQKTGDNVLLFNFPLKVRFRGAFGTTNRTVQVSQKEEDFTFKLDSAPSLVRFDPDYALLAKINFTVPSAMLAEQLADKDNLIGRLLALDQIKDNKSRETIARLKHALNNDPFYGVRIQAATILRTLHTDEAFETLLASREQSDARVRREVVNALAGFYRNETYEAMRKVLDSEKNPDILVIAIRALGAYPQPEVKDLLLKYLDSDSYRNELAVGALEAMRAQDDPVYVATLLERLPKREPDFTSRGYAQGLGALAFLARNEENKAAVRDFLLGYLNSKKRSVQYASITGLGTLGDPKAVAALETFTTAAKDSRERTAAAQAIADLRAARKPVDEFRGLRTEVMDLQKTTRELRKELDALKKKSEANSAGGTAKPAAKKTKSKPVAASPRSQ